MSKRWTGYIRFTKHYSTDIVPVGCATGDIEEIDVDAATRSEAARLIRSEAVSLYGSEFVGDDRAWRIADVRERFGLYF